jgi:hypothetical protein
MGKPHHTVRKRPPIPERERRAIPMLRHEETRLRIFVVEALDPMDLLQARGEAQSLQSACALIGHEVATMPVRSKEELKTAFTYISSIDKKQDQTGKPNLTLCVHISAHGNGKGIVVARDTVTWEKLFLSLKPLCSKLPWYNGKVVIVLSACYLSEQKLTDAIRTAHDNKSLTPPSYVFTTAEDEVLWPDSLMSWLLFYHQLPKASLDDRKSVQAVLNKVKDAGTAKLIYYRWDGKSYKRFASG